MQSVINDMYEGDIHPSETLAPQAPEYWEMSKKIGQEKMYLANILEPEDRKRFDELDDMQAMAGRMIEKEFFAYGLKLGIMLMVEVMGEEVELPQRKTE